MRKDEPCAGDVKPSRDRCRHPGRPLRIRDAAKCRTARDPQTPGERGADGCGHGDKDPDAQWPGPHQQRGDDTPRQPRQEHDGRQREQPRFRRPEPSHGGHPHAGAEKQEQPPERGRNRDAGRGGLRRHRRQRAARRPGRQRDQNPADCGGNRQPLGRHLTRMLPYRLPVDRLRPSTQRWARVRAVARFLLVAVWSGAAACGGSSPSSPTQTTTTTVPIPDGPKLSCPAPQSAPSALGTPIAVLYGTPITANGSPPVTTTCTPASGSVFNVGVSTVTCTATDALQRTDSCSFAVTVTAPPMIAVTRLMAFGDSITKGEDGTSLTASAVSRYTPSQILPTPQTYPGVLQTLLSTRYTAQMPTLDNQGCSG